MEKDSGFEGSLEFGICQNYDSAAVPVGRLGFLGPHGWCCLGCRLGCTSVIDLDGLSLSTFLSVQVLGRLGLGLDDSCGAGSWRGRGKSSGMTLGGDSTHLSRCSSGNSLVLERRGGILDG